jgi:hypothetical protein
MAATDYFLILLAPSFLFILSLLFLRNNIKSTNRTNSFKETSPCHLQALCTILTPTNSAWPTQYASLLTCKIRRNPDVIEIQISKLINNIRHGALELRDPRVLADIFRGQLYVYGWKVSIGLDLPRPWGFLYSRRSYSLSVDQVSRRYIKACFGANPHLGASTGIHAVSFNVPCEVASPLTPLLHSVRSRP